MSNIIERLRDPTTRWVALSEPDPLRLEAADQIERLCARIKDLEEQVLTALGERVKHSTTTRQGDGT